MSFNSKSLLLAYAFRPFFLLASTYAALVVLAWAAFLFINLPIATGWSALHWHSHEMLYGLVPAAISGFLLTAITNWTGCKPLRGVTLLALILLWLAGRCVFWLAGDFSGWLVLLIDMAFLPAVVVYTTMTLLRYRNHRNLVLAATLALMSLGNLTMHIGLLSGHAVLLDAGQTVGLYSVVILMTVIAGRITPAFSRNWLRMQGGDSTAVVISPGLDRWALFSICLLLLLELVCPGSLFTGMAALLAALLNGLRLLRWRGWLTIAEPLLWILHLAYLWLVTALVLRGLVLVGVPLPESLWLHTFGVGAVGVLLIGVMSRVALGHTGRPLRLPSGGLVMFAAINLAALVRLGTAMGWVDYRLGISLSAIAWALAFGLYVVLFAPILVSPRPDGRGG